MEMECHNHRHGGLELLGLKSILSKTQMQTSETIISMTVKSLYDLSRTTRVSQWKKLDPQKKQISSKNQFSIHCQDCEVTYTHTHTILTAISR